MSQDLTIKQDDGSKLVCVVCGERWLPELKNICACGGFCTWGSAKGADPDSWKTKESTVDDLILVFKSSTKGQERDFEIGQRLLLERAIAAETKLEAALLEITKLKG